MAVVVTVGKGIPAQFHQAVVDRILIVLIGLPLYHGDGVLWARAKTRAQPITVNVAYQFRFPIYYLQGALGAIGHAQPASVTLVLVDVYHCSDCHDFLLEIGDL
jgi:hypothetical protein